MKILHCSDFHGHVEWMTWMRRVHMDYDLLVFSGDLAGEKSTADGLQSWVHSFSRPLAICTGNHDYTDQETSYLASLGGRGSRGILVDGSKHTIGGWEIEVLGESDSLTLGGGFTIAVSHTPPAGAACAGHRVTDGDALLRRAIDLNGPDLLFCGHVHNPRIWWDRVGQTAVFNPGRASELDRVPRHIIVDTDARTAELRTWKGTIEKRRIRPGP